MITLTREEAQQVLDALANAVWCVQHNNLPPDDGHDWDKELELLRARLSAPEREWQGLTDEEIDKALWENESNYLPDIIRIAEAKLKEKNG